MMTSYIKINRKIKEFSYLHKVSTLMNASLNTSIKFMRNEKTEVND